MSSFLARAATLTALFVAALPAAASAQRIQGRVVDGTSGRPLGSASVVALDVGGGEAGRAVADEDGRFALQLREEGAYRLRVEALGYATVETEPVRPGEDEAVSVDVRLGVEALAVAPLVVTARSRIPRFPAFAARMEAGRQSGRGFFLERKDLEEAQGTRLSNVLMRVPGAPLRRDGRGRVFVGRSARTSALIECSPGLFVDGVRMNPSFQPIDELANPIELEGVEVYRSQSEVPPELGGSQLCGAVALWTRQGEKRSGGGSWWPTIVLGSLLGGMLIYTLVK